MRTDTSITRKKQILIVDDEEDIREILTFNLEAEGYEVLSAESANAAEAILSKDTNLILLDVMMPGISGFRWAEQLMKREDFHTPIIFLTARDTENDLLTGFSVGADDYISKPFSIKELIARTKAVLARSEQTQDGLEPSKGINLGPLRIDNQTKSAFYNGKQLTLTRKEMEVLLLLAATPGRIFGRTEILDRIWSEEVFVMERTVDVHIARLRKKLGEGPIKLANRSGFGYYLTLDDTIENK